MKKGETTSRMSCGPDTRDRYEVPVWGFLERFELHPRVELPNMVASEPFELVAELRRRDGTRIPLQVFAVVRDVVSE